MYETQTNKLSHLLNETLDFKNSHITELDAVPPRNKQKLQPSLLEETLDFKKSL